MNVRKSKYLELDDGAGARIVRRLLSHVAEQGFFSYALLSRDEWIAVLSARGPAQEEGTDAFEATAAEARKSSALEALRTRYALDEQGAMLVVALRYAPDVELEGEAASALDKSQGLPRLPAPVPGQPVARVGRFARGNWYREVLDRLAVCAKKTACEMVAEGFPQMPAKCWHRFVNSRFPEKALAVTAGLGTIGRNSLLIAERSDALENGGASTCAQAPRWSSAVVLGLMFLPFDVPPAVYEPRRPPRAALELCASCTRCVEACPTGALSGTLVETANPSAPSEAFPSFARFRCIQHYTSIEGILPEFINKAWSDQFYGCDICLEACPHFVPDPAAKVRRGKIGGSFDATALAMMESSALKASLKTSALDQRWISITALKRNASRVASRVASGKPIETR